MESWKQVHSFSINKPVQAFVTETKWLENGYNNKDDQIQNVVFARLVFIPLIYFKENGVK